MKDFFEPKSVAIIGASRDENKIGNILLRNLLSFRQKNKKLKIFPVNPKGGKINGLKVYPSVLDIEGEVDLAVIAVPAPIVNKVVEESAWRAQPIKNFIIISAGFGEAGSKGRREKEELLKLIKKYDLRVLGPNCLGIINAHSGLNLSFAPGNITRGKIGLISQSGALITALLDLARVEHFGFSLIASLGNKIDLNENDLLDYYQQQAATEIIILYLEDIRQGKRFVQILEKAVQKKPVIILTAGLSEKTKQAIQSHTGSMAGEATVVREALKDAGGIVVDNFIELVNILKVLNYQQAIKEKIKGEDLVIVTNAGGPGVVTTDILLQHNLSLRDFTKAEKKKLSAVLPKESSVNNPIDLLGDALADRYHSVLNILNDLSQVKGIIVLVTPQAQTPIAEITAVVNKFSRRKPIYLVVLGGEAYQLAQDSQKNSNLFRFPQELITALAQINRSQQESIKGDNEKRIATRSGEEITLNHREEELKTKRRLLLYPEVQKISHRYGLKLLPGKYITSREDIKKISRKWGWPLVFKVDSPNLAHKSDQGGVRLNISSLTEAEQAWRELRQAFPQDLILAQPQVPFGREVILGFKRDHSFGLVLMIGLGGIIAEIIDEKILLTGKINRQKIKNKLAKSRLGQILNKEGIDQTKLVEQAERLATLGRNEKQILEVDINPLFLYPDKEPVIVDFKIITGS